MKSLFVITILSISLFSSCKKDEKKPRNISFTYTLPAEDQFEVTVEKNGEVMYGYSDEKYTAYPQGDGTFLMGSSTFEAKKGDKISVYVVDNYLSNNTVSFTLKVNDSQVTTSDVNSMESAINITYTVE